jgi:2-methylaconitate cis-trans-isomerase PrpF
MIRTDAMQVFETSATVEDRGQVRVDGVPFAPGTEVEVTISPKARSAGGSAHPNGEPTQSGTALRWQGNVLVHDGVGTGPSVAELRDERLTRLGEGRPE